MQRQLCLQLDEFHAWISRTPKFVELLESLKGTSAVVVENLKQLSTCAVVCVYKRGALYGANRPASINAFHGKW
jgi:hypothetical protein